VITGESRAGGASEAGTGRFHDVVARPERGPKAATSLRGPIDRITESLPSPWRTIVDWTITIVVAIAAVLAIKAWVVNPYRIPSSSMEPSLHCAEPEPGCEASFSDRVLANRFIYHFKDPERGDIVVFETPPMALELCGAGGTFVKRLVGLPGDVIEVRRGIVMINGKRLEESYIEADRRGGPDYGPKKVPPEQYFMMGDNRGASCDSRVWGSVPRQNLIGEVFAVYWPPQRIGFR
jgi:signal peptidase I